MMSLYFRKTSCDLLFQNENQLKEHKKSHLEKKKTVYAKMNKTRKKDKKMSVAETRSRLPAVSLL